MSSARRSTLVAAGVASALFLSLKAYTGGTPVIPGVRPVIDGVAGMMAQAGYATIPTGRTLPLGLKAFGRGPCNLMIGVMNTFGSEDRIIHQYVPRGWTLSFVFDGAVTADPPYARALTSDYVSRMVWLFDPNVPFRPILPVVHNGRCDLDALPWRTLPALPYSRRGPAA